MARYTDDELSGIESATQALLDEAQGALSKTDKLFESLGLSERKTVSGFLQQCGSSEQMHELRTRNMGDPSRDLLEEEKRLVKETQKGAPTPARRRRRMARV